MEKNSRDGARKRRKKTHTVHRRRFRNSPVNNKSIFCLGGGEREGTGGRWCVYVCVHIGYIRPLRIQRMCCPALGSCLGFMSGFLCRVVYTGAYVNADVIFFSTYSPRELPSRYERVRARAQHICSIRNEPVGGPRVVVVSRERNHEIAMRTLRRVSRGICVFLSLPRRERENSAMRFSSKRIRVVR